MGYNRLLWVLILSSISFMAACGGGGSEGGSTTALPSLSYTGAASLAVIDETSAAALTTGSVNGGIQGSRLSNFASLTSDTAAPDQKRYNVFATAIIIQHAVLNLDAYSEASVNSGRAIYTEEETISGSCGGQATGLLQIDDVTGDFWGDLTFTNYCDSNVTLNGNTNFSGTINTTSGEFENITLSFDYLKSNDPTGSYIFDGSYSIDFINPSRFTLSMDMYLQDGSTKDVYWIKNYLLDVEDYGSYVSMNLSGQFYNPHYGYVTLTTQQNLIVGYYDQNPSSGVIIVVGENGISAGPTMARLTCFPNDIFQVEADTDGDGLYDWVSGDLYWGNY
jgi:hypothetical protein